MLRIGARVVKSLAPPRMGSDPSMQRGYFFVAVKEPPVLIVPFMVLPSTRPV